MRLNGEDKRIRALFYELKREEKRTSPPFAKLWNIAEAEFHCRGFSRPRFQLSSNLLRFATAILVVSLVVAATVLLPRYLRLRRQPMHDHAKEMSVVPRAVSEEPPRSESVPANRESGKPSDRVVAIRRSVRIKKSEIASAQRARRVNQTGLSKWQSPTASLLRSAGDELLMFVPQMNEAAEEMKKFLSNDLN
jgi:hypothetical protein